MDLLSPLNPSAYSQGDLHLSYMENGFSKTIPVTVYQLKPNADQYVLSTDIGWHADLGRTFYLQLSPNDIDTIYARVDKITGSCTWFKSKEFLYNNRTQSQGSVPSSSIAIYSIRK